MKEPIIAVGITSGKKISFTLTGLYRQPATDGLVSGANTVTMSESGLTMEWNGCKYTTLTFDPTSFEGDSFQLEGVTIGVDFHWERKENQTFRGSLRLVVSDGLIIAINDVPTEEYLKSVVSSEMKATSSLSLLRAHAVISRSWLFAQIFKAKEAATGVERGFRDEKEIVKWWDHDDHTLFDVCADDHCQRYQGISKIVDGKAVGAVEDTRGEVLKYNSKLCDTRFSKCCGGVFERFESCWEQTPHPYLAPRRDGVNENDYPDLTNDATAAGWIESEPTAFCNTTDRRILSQVLNEYDIESTDFYRWTETYTQEEIQELLRTRSDINVGKVLSLTPMERGTSGRVVRLKITGTEGEIIIGKELMIRRSLSRTHLRSSAFTVKAEYENGSEIPTSFTLRGAGWGHGVGLCQIGAAVMGERGYSYAEILRHYYPGANIEKCY